MQLGIGHGHADGVLETVSDQTDRTHQDRAVRAHLRTDSDTDKVRGLAPITASHQRAPARSRCRYWAGDPVSGEPAAASQAARPTFAAVLLRMLLNRISFSTLPPGRV